jgi:hypothetical protein
VRRNGLLQRGEHLLEGVVLEEALARVVHGDCREIRNAHDLSCPGSEPEHASQCRDLQLDGRRLRVLRVARLDVFQDARSRDGRDQIAAEDWFEMLVPALREIRHAPSVDGVVALHVFEQFADARLRRLGRVDFLFDAVQPLAKNLPRFLGWYLMAPPLDPKGKVDAPLGKWQVLDSLDTATACGLARDAALESAKGEIGKLEAELQVAMSAPIYKDPKQPTHEEWEAGRKNFEEKARDIRTSQVLLDERAQSTVCVATDDPRLAK